MLGYTPNRLELGNMLGCTAGNKSAEGARREYRQRYPNRPLPHVRVFVECEKRFRESFKGWEEKFQSES